MASIGYLVDVGSTYLVDVGSAGQAFTWSIDTRGRPSEAIVSYNGHQPQGSWSRHRFAG